MRNLIYTDDKGNRFKVRPGIDGDKYAIFKRPFNKSGWHTYSRPAQWFTDPAEAEAALDEKAKKKGWWIV